jgi:hypothetical protein
MTAAIRGKEEYSVAPTTQNFGPDEGVRRAAGKSEREPQGRRLGEVLQSFQKVYSLKY